MECLYIESVVRATPERAKRSEAEFCESFNIITLHLAPPLFLCLNEEPAVARYRSFKKNLPMGVERGRVGHQLKNIKTMLRMLPIEIISALCRKILPGSNFGGSIRGRGTQYEKSVYTILIRNTCRYITLLLDFLIMLRMRLEKWICKSRDLGVFQGGQFQNPHIPT